MTQKCEIISPNTISATNNVAEFKRDILQGLSTRKKTIHSKYFYDDIGCDLFNRISHHPDYYLSRCELEIIRDHKQEISHLLRSKPFNLVELGPGDGTKTKLLINQFMRDALDFTYFPIELSQNFLEQIVHEFGNDFPQLEINALHANYINGLEWISQNSSLPKLILFLGSSVANLDLKEREEFLQNLWNSLNRNDHVLIGFDLRKNVNILLRAYDDSDGLTQQFNLNVLHRINRELHADFNINKFCHRAIYNDSTGSMESYLLSLENQSVLIKDLDKTIPFLKNEPIHVEYSFKFNEQEIIKLARESGFDVMDMYIDKKNYFLDSLWRVIK